MILGEKMTVRECYEKFGGNFDSVCSRLMDESRVQKFVLKFLDTSEFESLKEGLQAEDWGKAFLAAHTLKGIALNLSFDNLASKASDLTELLRPKTKPDQTEQARLFALLEEEYNKTFGAITELKDSL